MSPAWVYDKARRTLLPAWPTPHLLDRDIDLQKLHQLLWDIRSDAMRAAHRVHDGDIKATAEIIGHIVERALALQLELHTPDALKRKPPPADEVP